MLLKALVLSGAAVSTQAQAVLTVVYGCGDTGAGYMLCVVGSPGDGDWNCGHCYQPGISAPAGTPPVVLNNMQAVSAGLRPNGKGVLTSTQASKLNLPRAERKGSDQKR